ncbi:hypothetical protein [Streptomyces candidus]|uniref:Uncharacterized protein n=1 Tax=Streptomyces candidus TaxID=67283 RepID=A0A7X0LQ26_9ACTN|nr:hypothetical protein [Streptomyces candidus]GHH50667.1 hypothetical protein GCM10018773_48000 [Streptomyces candidus]
MSHRLADRLTRMRRTGAGTGAGGPSRLLLPPALDHTPLGCDAVGLPAHYGQRLLDQLSRPGCVFADGDLWWWIVPSGSDLGLPWPEPAQYAAEARVPATRPRLVHTPQGPAPYTPPIPLYLMVCRLAGTAPVWSDGLTAPA